MVLTVPHAEPDAGSVMHWMLSTGWQRHRFNLPNHVAICGAHESRIMMKCMEVFFMAASLIIDFIHPPGLQFVAHTRASQLS